MRRTDPQNKAVTPKILAARVAKLPCALLLAYAGAAWTQEGQPSAVPETAPVSKPPKESERVGEFADSVAEAALTSDPDAIYRKEGQRRVVELGVGWSAWLDRTQASQLNNPTSAVAAAGGRESRVGFDFKGQTGLTARIGTVDLSTARVNEFKLAAAPAQVGSFSWALGLDQLRSKGIGIDRADASALASYRFSPQWLIEAGPHRASLKDDSSALDAKANFARTKLSFTPQSVPGLTLSSQWWQAVGSDDRGRVSFNADYALDNGTRLYAGTSPRLSLLSGGGLLASQTFAHVVGAQTPLAPFVGRGWGEVYGEWRGKSLADSSDQVLLTGWRNRFALPSSFSGEVRLEHTEPLAGPNPQRVNTIGAGVNRRIMPENIIGTWFEYTHAETSHSSYGLIKYTQRVTDDAVATFRIQAEDARPNEGVGGTTDLKFTSGIGWREPTNKRFGLIGRYTFEDKDARDPGQFDRQAQIVSGQFQYNLKPRAFVAGRYLVRWVREESATGTTPRTTQLVAGRIVWPVLDRWDVSAHAAAHNDQVLRPKTAFGAEVGFRLSSKVILAGGANVRGFADSELEAEDRFRKGAYLRLRFAIDALVARWLDVPRKREEAATQ